MTGDRGPGHEVDRVVPFGKAAVEILRIARERTAGLIVMGTHGSRSLHSVVFGSTARLVIRKAPCPVLSLRRADMGGLDAWEGEGGQLAGHH